MQSRLSHLQNQMNSKLTQEVINEANEQLSRMLQRRANYHCAKRALLKFHIIHFVFHVKGLLRAIF